MPLSWEEQTVVPIMLTAGRVVLINFGESNMPFVELVVEIQMVLQVHLEVGHPQMEVTTVICQLSNLN